MLSSRFAAAILGSLMGPLATIQISAQTVHPPARGRGAPQSEVSGAGKKLTPKEFSGKAVAGKAYFYGKGGCSVCHSPTGDLAGIAKKYAPIDLEALMLYPPVDKKSATVTLPSGRVYRGKLLHLDAFDVAIRSRNGTYHSWPRKDVSIKIDDPLAAHRKLLGTYDNREIHNLLAYLETLQ